MFGSDEVDVMYVAFLLELDIPFGQFFGCEVEAVALVSDVLSTPLVPIPLSFEKIEMLTTYMILTKHTPKITPREKHRSTTVVPLDTGFFPSMRRDHIDFSCLRSD